MIKSESAATVITCDSVQKLQYIPHKDNFYRIFFQEGAGRVPVYAITGPRKTTPPPSGILFLLYPEICSGLIFPDMPE